MKDRRSDRVNITLIFNGKVPNEELTHILDNLNLLVTEGILDSFNVEISCDTFGMLNKAMFGEDGINV